MADQDTDSAPAAAAVTPQAGAEEGRPQAGAAQETISLEEARKLRREAQSLRKRLEDYEASKLSETERLNKKNQELEQQLASLFAERQERITREAIQAAGAKAGAVYPDTLYRLANPTEIELDEAGNVRNATALVNRLRQTYPALFRAMSIDGGASGQAPGGELDMNRLIRQAAGRGQ